MTRAPIVPQVSDHALLRYIERVHGIDLDALRREILTPEIILAIKAGATAVYLNGHRVPVERGVIVTVLPRGAKPKRSRNAVMA